MPRETVKPQGDPSRGLQRPRNYQAMPPAGKALSIQEDNPGLPDGMRMSTAPSHREYAGQGLSSMHPLIAWKAPLLNHNESSQLPSSPLLITRVPRKSSAPTSSKPHSSLRLRFMAGQGAGGWCLQPPGGPSSVPSQVPAVPSVAGDSGTGSSLPTHTRAIPWPQELAGRIGQGQTRAPAKPKILPCGPKSKGRRQGPRSTAFRRSKAPGMSSQTSRLGATLTGNRSPRAQLTRAAGCATPVRACGEACSGLCCGKEGTGRNRRQVLPRAECENCGCPDQSHLGSTLPSEVTTCSP